MGIKSFSLGIVLGVALGLSLAYRKFSKKIRKEKEGINDCLFFTPIVEQCNECLDITDLSVLNLKNCCNYKKLIKTLLSAKKHLDVCVYLITCEEISSAIMHLFNKGVYVRIITDKQMAEEASSAKVIAFRRLYIPLKVIRTNMMHNKFVIIDKSILLTGSFNWTRSGLKGNYENGIITSNKTIVTHYHNYFDHLWDDVI